MIAALLGRIAREIIELQKQEIAELEEPYESGKIGSSTMPQKRNPMLWRIYSDLGSSMPGKASNRN